MRESRTRIRLAALDGVWAIAMRQVLSNKASGCPLVDLGQRQPVSPGPMCKVSDAVKVVVDGRGAVTTALKVRTELRNVGLKNAALQPRAHLRVNCCSVFHDGLLASEMPKQGDHRLCKVCVP